MGPGGNSVLHVFWGGMFPVVRTHWTSLPSPLHEIIFSIGMDGMGFGGMGRMGGMWFISSAILFFFGLFWSHLERTCRCYWFDLHTVVQGCSVHLDGHYPNFTALRKTGVNLKQHNVFYFSILCTINYTTLYYTKLFVYYCDYNELLFFYVTTL